MTRGICLLWMVDSRRKIETLHNPSEQVVTCDFLVSSDYLCQTRRVSFPSPPPLQCLFHLSCSGVPPCHLLQIRLAVCICSKRFALSHAFLPFQPASPKQHLRHSGSSLLFFTFLHSSFSPSPLSSTLFNLLYSLFTSRQLYLYLKSSRKLDLQLTW